MSQALLDSIKKLLSLLLSFGNNNDIDVWIFDYAVGNVVNRDGHSLGMVWWNIYQEAG